VRSSPEPLGLSLVEGGANVAVFSAHARRVELCLFDPAGEAETARVTLDERTGDVFHGFVAGIAAGQRYGLRAEGPFDPAAGHRFDPAKLLLDPYAVAIDRPFALHRAMFDVFAGGEAGVDSAPCMPKAIALPSPPERARVSPHRIPWPDTIVYELHVKGFSRRHPAIAEAVRGCFAALAEPAAIAHLRRLGVTTVELMPAVAWLDERHLTGAGLTNYWGYNPVALLVPDPRLAPGGWEEVRGAVAALQEAGIEVILDVVLNHTGEGDEHGPTVSLRGLDNATYYRLDPGARGRYINDTGCGNTLALDRPAVLRLAMDSLRAWAERAGLDGFRFDLATTLGRRDHGFDPAAPLLAAIEQDPVLRRLKLIAEPWDIGPGGYQLGAFPAGWGEWNDRFRDDVRRFWRGDPGRLGALATGLAGSGDAMAAHRRLSRSLNFVVAHDGFTLADLVAHERKHNAANAEDNRDGTDANFSWNNGAEGGTGDPGILAARARDQRNLLATLLLARGTPMLTAGAEFGQSQCGNNNAYAQDNATAWLDWARADDGLIGFTARLIALRKSHPALTADRLLTGAPAAPGAPPDVAWLRADGAPMRDADWHDGEARALLMVLAEPTPSVDRVAVALNAGRTATSIRLPWPRPGWRWRREIDAAEPLAAPVDIAAEANGQAGIAARSVVAFVEIPDASCGGLARDDGETLARLAAAAGIAADWWDLGGGRHVVSAETTRALLAAIGLPAGAAGEARDSLARLAESRDLRKLPEAVVRRASEPIAVAVPADGGATLHLTIAGPDRDLAHIRSGGGPDTSITAADGRAVPARRINLPPLPQGLYRLIRDDAPDIASMLIVAPPRCHLPPDLAAGARRFGISAHLYALRGARDQGIGDFTVLGEFAAASAKAGAATVGLNPLHALFNDDRERASPYHPSDRRFLDPIYIDVTALAPMLDDADFAARLLASDRAFAALRARPLVDYTGVWAAKRTLLEAAHAAFRRLAGNRPDAAPVAEHRAFIAAGGDNLRRFAVFEAIVESRPGESWDRWPATLRRPDAAGVAAFAAEHGERVAFHQFLQWLADRGLRDAAGRAGLSLGLYRDLAIGAAPDGAEAWAAGGGLLDGISIGAPPDRFSPDGQVWHLPPPNPIGLAVGGYAAVAALFAANMRHAGGLRIDHVMGLTRLFCIPAGAGGSAGAYLRYPLDDLLGVLAAESQHARCLIVGEDLGTVPDGLRERLADNDILSYRVLWFERDGLAFKPPASYPKRAVACVSTHDLPTLAGWWAGDDIAERRRLGLWTDAEADEAARIRNDERVSLSSALAEVELMVNPRSQAPPIVEITAYAGLSPSCLLLCQADDLAGERAAVNLPGTDRERPNWRRRIGMVSADLFANPQALAVLAKSAEGRVDHASRDETPVEREHR